jgi:hypothetical protein
MDGCKMTSEEEEIEVMPFSPYAAVLFVGFIYISPFASVETINASDSNVLEV